MLVTTADARVSRSALFRCSSLPVGVVNRGLALRSSGLRIQSRNAALYRPIGGLAWLVVGKPNAPGGPSWFPGARGDFASVTASICASILASLCRALRSKRLSDGFQTRVVGRLVFMGTRRRWRRSRRRQWRWWGLRAFDAAGGGAHFGAQNGLMREHQSGDGDGFRGTNRLWSFTWIEIAAALRLSWLCGRFHGISASPIRMTRDT